MAYGALGSLASRVEDASSIAAEGAWSRVAGLVPFTAPFAMPARIALGVTAGWAPVLARC